MLNVNLNNVEPAFGGGSFEHLPSGIYKCTITKAFNNEHPNNGKQARLELDMDIAEGEYKDFFSEAFDALGFWTLIDYENYGSEKSMPYFKGYLKRVADTTPSYKPSLDERKLEGTNIYCAIQAEQRLSKKGNPTWRYSVVATYSAQEVKSKKTYNNSNLVDLVDIELPKDATATSVEVETVDVNPDLSLSDDIQF